jgi:hypothetical protein
MRSSALPNLQTASPVFSLRGFFSRPLDYGNLVRIFYVIEIARFIACSQPVLFELLLGYGEDLTANWCINFLCISCH